MARPKLAVRHRLYASDFRKDEECANPCKHGANGRSRTDDLLITSEEKTISRYVIETTSFFIDITISMVYD